MWLENASLNRRTLRNPAAKAAWPEACPFRGGCRTKEHNIRRTGWSHWTNRTAIDPCRSNAREKYAIECPVSRQASAVAYLPIETRRQSRHHQIQFRLAD